jgi:TIR domain
MSIDKALFGEIFLSHSSVDKPFARKLAPRIEKAGFRTWLDEKQWLLK